MEVQPLLIYYDSPPAAPMPSPRPIVCGNVARRAVAELKFERLRRPPPASVVPVRGQPGLSSKCNISPMRPADDLAKLGVPRQSIHKLTLKDPTFPKPAADLATGRVGTADIEKWAKATGRTVRHR